MTSSSTSALMYQKWCSARWPKVGGRPPPNAMSYSRSSKNRRAIASATSRPEVLGPPPWAI